jgi:hypothetical protein
MVRGSKRREQSKQQVYNKGELHSNANCWLLTADAAPVDAEQNPSSRYVIIRFSVVGPALIPKQWLSTPQLWKGRHTACHV